MTDRHSNHHLVKLLDFIFWIIWWWLFKNECTCASQELIWTLKAQFQIWISSFQVWCQPCKFHPSGSICINHLYYTISEQIPCKERLWFLSCQKRCALKKRLLKILDYYLAIKVMVFLFSFLLWFSITNTFRGLSLSLSFPLSLSLSDTHKHAYK